MIRTALSDAKKHLSELVARVGRGETVIVTKRGKPVARIEAVSTAEVDGDAEVGATRGDVDRSGLARALHAPPRLLWPLMDGSLLSRYTLLAE